MSKKEIIEEQLKQAPKVRTYTDTERFWTSRGYNNMKGNEEEKFGPFGSNEQSESQGDQSHYTSVYNEMEKHANEYLNTPDNVSLKIFKDIVIKNMQKFSTPPNPLNYKSIKIASVNIPPMESTESYGLQYGVNHYTFDEEEKVKTDSSHIKEKYTFSNSPDYVSLEHESFMRGIRRLREE